MDRILYFQNQPEGQSQNRSDTACRADGLQNQATGPALATISAVRRKTRQRRRFQRQIPMAQIIIFPGVRRSYDDPAHAPAPRPGFGKLLAFRHAAHTSLAAHRPAGEKDAG